MPERTEFEYLQQRKALEFTGIDIESWNSRTPEDRKKEYHKKIMKVILKNHPDKHPGLAEDSAEHLKWVENTKLLTSISYDYGTVPDDISQHSADASYFSSSEVPNPFSNSSSSTQSSQVFTPPKSVDELASNLRRSGSRPPLNGKYYPTPGYELNKGTAYYEGVKEYIPNLLRWEDWGKLDQSKCGSDFGFVTEQIATKLYLKDYLGADVFVSAMVSQDKARIKAAFDQMIANIKNRNIFLSLFSSTQSQLAMFVDKFCRFTPKGDRGAIEGIDAYTILLLCQSLSLMLPYHIIDPDFDMDQELIRTLLTQYVSGHATTLQLEAGVSSSPAIMNQTGK